MTRFVRLFQFIFTMGIVSAFLLASYTDPARAASTRTDKSLDAEISLEADAPAQGRYATGNPSLRDVWVDPVNGRDSNDGATPASALRTLGAAWNRIPMKTVLSEGVRINLQPGNYPESSIPVYWESRYGKFSAPIWIRGNGTRDQIVLQGGLNVYDTRYFYLENLSVIVRGDAFHCEKCNHVLLRNVKLDGRGSAQETLKVNQSKYFYVENSELAGATDNVIDFVAVQYAHILKNTIHNSVDWCVYTKGGSAYIRVEGNSIYRVSESTAATTS